MFLVVRVVPGAAPMDVTAAALDSRSIKVTWNPPPVDQQNGQIVSYVIRYQKVAPNRSRSNGEGHETSSTSSSYSNFMPSSSSANVTDFNVVKSTSVYAMNSVDNEVDVESPSSSSSSSSSPNNYTAAGWREELAEPTARSHVIKNLSEWTLYRIRISAATKIGPGPHNVPDLVVRTDEFGMFCFVFTFGLSFSFILLFLFCLITSQVQNTPSSSSSSPFASEQHHFSLLILFCSHPEECLALVPSVSLSHSPTCILRRKGKKGRKSEGNLSGAPVTSILSFHFNLSPQSSYEFSSLILFSSSLLLALGKGLSVPSL